MYKPNLLFYIDENGKKILVAPDLLSLAKFRLHQLILDDCRRDLKAWELIELAAIKAAIKSAEGK